MIYLYNSTETDFRYNGKPLPAAYDVTVSNTLNSEYYVMGKYPLDKDKVYKEIVEDCIIKVHTMDGMEPFRIVSVSKHELYVEFEAWPLFYADMRNKLIRPFKAEQADGRRVMYLFSNALLTETPFRFHSEHISLHNYQVQSDDEMDNNPNQLYNALDVFKEIVATWNSEVLIRGYDVRLNTRIGRDTEALLYEKKNITEFVDASSIKNLVTRLHGKAEWEEEVDVLIPPTEGEEDQEPRYRKEKESHSISVTVDSPLIDYYGGVVFEQQLTNNDLRTEEELEEWLLAKFEVEHIDKPQRTIEVGTNLIGTDELTIGDTLILKYTQHDVDMRIKVIGYEHDGFANETTKIILGQPKQTASSAIGNTIVDLVNDAVEPVDRKTTIALGSANGKNTNFYGTEDPNTLNLDAQENDAYFRTNGDERELWIFTGTVWELVLDTSDTTKNAREIEAVIEQAEADKQALETEINQTYEDAVAEADRLAAIRDNGITIEAGQIIAGTIDAARLDAVSIVTSGLYSNVIKSTHIESSNLLVDKIFSTSGYIDRLTSKTAFISNIKAIEISADKITTGTLNAADVRIINLDVGNISGFNSSFIQTRWNGINSSVQVNANGLEMMGSATWRRNIMNATGIELYNGYGGYNLAGTIGYFKGRLADATSGESVMDFRAGGHGIGIAANSSHHVAIGYNSSSYNNNRNYDSAIRVRGSDGNIYFDRQIFMPQANTHLHMYGNHIRGVQQVRIQGANSSAVAGIFNDGSNDQIWVQGWGGVKIGDRRPSDGSYQNHLHVTRLVINAYVPLNMNGNGITNQSDIRLKRNIEDSSLDALREIERLKFIEYDWDKEKSINEGKPTERQFGIVAQYSPFLQTKAGDSESYLSVDLTKQINLNSKGLQELLSYKRELEERIEVLESERTSA